MQNRTAARVFSDNTNIKGDYFMLNRKFPAAMLSAAILLGCLPVLPASAAEMQSGIYLAEKDSEKSFYLLRGDGTGTVHTANSTADFRIEQADGAAPYLIFAGSDTSAMLSPDQQNQNLLLQTDAGNETFLRYLQPYTEAFDLKSYRPSDMTQDGNISDYDVMLIHQYLIGEMQLSNVQKALADLNCDGILNAADLTIAKQRRFHPPAEPELPVHVMLDAPEYNQHPAYPTGCESIALYILLKYYDTDVTPEQIIEALPKGALPHDVDGTLYGTNPERAFVGDPATSYSYGVFNEPIANTAELFRSGVITKRDAAVEDMFPIISSGNPVVAWYTTKPDRDIFYRSQWYDDETGELIRWPGGEHAVVVCGYDLSSGTLTYRDPNTGGSNTLAISKFRRVFDELGGRIVYYES